MMIILALLTFGNSVLAQNNEDIDKQIDSQIERPAQQQRLRTDVRSLEMLTTDKGACPLGLQQVIMAGLNDNLAPANEATFNTLLKAVYPSPPYSYKDFDDKSVNKMVGHSFVLKNYKPCEGRACGGELLVRVCNFGTDLWTNDKIYVGTIVNKKLNASVFYGDIWSGQNEAKTCKDIKIPLTAAMLASMQTLDVLIQDDTAIDYIKLTFFY